LTVTLITPPKCFVHTRWMIRRDMPEVMRIERDSFAFPWTEDDFLKHLRQRHCIGMVAESPSGITGTNDYGIAGFFLYELIAKRMQLLNIAVAPEFIRRGVGSQMMHKLKTKLGTHKRDRIGNSVSPQPACALAKANCATVKAGAA
jgi:ribosomal-protein-alanine N-acetyltransferase